MGQNLLFSIHFLYKFIDNSIEFEFAFQPQIIGMIGVVSGDVQAKFLGNFNELILRRGIIFFVVQLLIGIFVVAEKGVTECVIIGVFGTARKDDKVGFCDLDLHL